MKIKLLVTLTAIVSFSAQAEIAIIAHPSVTDSVDASSIARIYLGKDDALPSGAQVVPVSRSPGAAADEFNQKVLKKSGSQLKSYWSKLVFTGKGSPPKEFATDAEIISLIAQNPNMIGFIDAASVADGVKVLGTY